jgi:hypothetical protein
VDGVKGKLRMDDHLHSNLETAGHRSYRMDAIQAEYAANRWSRNIPYRDLGWSRCTPGNVVDKANPPADPSAR